MKYTIYLTKAFYNRVLIYCNKKFSFSSFKLKKIYDYHDSYRVLSKVTNIRPTSFHRTPNHRTELVEKIISKTERLIIEYIK